MRMHSLLAKLGEGPALFDEDDAYCRLQRFGCSLHELLLPSTLPQGLCVVYFSYRGEVPLKLNRYTVPARGFSAEGKKGKQVQILYDLVTVKGECGACIMSLAKAREAAARRVKIRSQETCRMPVQEHPLRISRHWSYHHPCGAAAGISAPSHAEGFFLHAFFDPRRENQRRHNMKRRIAALLLSIAVIGTLHRMRRHSRKRCPVGGDCGYGRICS